jgi:SMI1 / KNR4 family (SUKH-1)
MDADVVVPIVLIAAVLPLAIGMLVVRDRYKAWRRRKSPEQLAAERQDLIQRLRRPEWPAIERALGRRVPNVLKDLYADSQWLTGEEFRVISPFAPAERIEDHTRVALSPATTESLATLEAISVDVFQFATDEFGNPYGVQLFEQPDGDGAVFLHMLDGDEVIRIADSLADFLSWPRHRVA